MVETLTYKPPPTIKAFIKDYLPGELFYDWIIGPYGSGKTTGIFFKLAYMAQKQAKGRDGVRRSRAVVVRNTMPQLKDTTLVSWNYWFKHGQAGEWRETDKKFILRFGDVECEVLFRALDTAEDIARVLSLEVTFAIIDEFVQIPKEIIDALSARLGRYPSARDGGATNWGMWGSSNPSTEDNWWFDYLHDPKIAITIDNRIQTADGGSTGSTGFTAWDAEAERARRALIGLPFEEINVKYFVQPSGYSPRAENIENLPGGSKYYDNQAKGKSEAWIKQYLEAEWGYSISGKAVVPTFKADIHIAKKPLLFNPMLPLVAGVDPGLAGSAVIFGQEDHAGRLLVLAELVQSGYGAERLITERIKPFVHRHFPNADLYFAPDPAAALRGQSDERTVISKFQKVYGSDRVIYESNNRLPLRLDAIEYYSCRLAEGGPALLIDPQMCPVLIRALKGGWRWEIDPKRDVLRSAKPEKNNSSHPGDAFGYLCRYFHKLVERGMRGGGKDRPFVPPRTFGANYHFR